ncbi:MAG: CoA-binding protein [Thermodesulfobacteriota bacterium]|nr:CoA-binding protein [Thermodesulfobacteriota bacterium]
MAWNPEFNVAFNPKTIAVVGASTTPSWIGGTSFITHLQDFGYPGRIYPINPKADGMEIRGLKAYPNLTSVPEPIDLVIISVPAPVIHTVLEDCIAANAKNIYIFTAGFDETGEEEGLKLGARLKEIAVRGQLRIIGPNCMGLYVPAAKMSIWEGTPVESGKVGLISQSGGHAGQFVSNASVQGIGISKAISFGNGTIMEATDFLEYFANDAETEIIAMYLEGTRDGQKLLKLIREINKTKPIIIWKGGLTESGARAVASHTGSLGGEREIWNTFFHQTGAVGVDSLEELVDVTMTFLHLSPRPQGRRVALLGAGGGNSVAGADTLNREGLVVPKLSDATRKKLRDFIPSAGTSIANPLDIGLVLRDISLLERALDPISADPNIDAMVFGLPIGLLSRVPDTKQTDDELQTVYETETKNRLEVISKFNKESANRKPVVVVPRGWRPERVILEEARRAQTEFAKAGIPAYASLQQAGKAMAKFMQYQESKKNGA